MILEHPAELTYDLRTRAGIGVEDLGTTWSWQESLWFVQQLLTDPSAHTTAVLLDWSFPASRSWLTLADLFDVTARDRRGRPAKSPRPWKSSPAGVRKGRTSLPPGEAINVLMRNARGEPGGR